jgi:hypothetical protein
LDIDFNFKVIEGVMQNTASTKLKGHDLTAELRDFTVSPLKLYALNGKLGVGASLLGPSHPPKPSFNVGHPHCEPT